MVLKKYIYLLGMLLRNKKIFDNYRFLMQSQSWDIDKLRHHQCLKLRELVNHAYRNAEFYRNLFDSFKISPKEIITLNDLKKIPPVSKEQLLTNVEKIQLKNYPEKLFFSETSGSTGRPLVFYRNADWDAWHRASVFRGYSWYGVKPWESNGYLWGYNFSLTRRLKTQFLDYLQNRFRLFSYKDDEVEKFVAKLKKTSYLGGYSSMIYEIAKKINQKDAYKAGIKLKMVKGTSEKIFAKYQDEARRAFDQTIISEYGAAETGIIAFECPSGNMHINMETVIVEEEDKEIIVTNLVSRSFPIIRYKLGDYIELAGNIDCDCGMKHHVIKEVTGRVGKVIYGFNNEYPSLTLYYVFKNLAIDKNVVLNYQAIQSKKGYLTVNIDHRLESYQRKLLSKEFEKYFLKDIILNIRDEKVFMSGKGKRQDFISNI